MQNFSSIHSKYSSSNGRGGGGSEYLETYSKNLKVSIRNFSEKSNSYIQQTSISSVRVTLIYCLQNSDSTHKEITLRLTNDLDPLFFFYFIIHESEYPSLKQSQGLLVDFNGFPAQLISLLDKCDDEKFKLVLNLGRELTSLDIVESNPFKYLSHLSLLILPGSDSELKKYLAQLTNELKLELEQLTSKLSQIQTTFEIELKKLKFEIANKDEVIRKQRDETNAQLTQLADKHFKDLSSEKERVLIIQSELVNKYESEKRDMSLNYNEITNKLEAKITALESEKRDFENEVSHKASIISELDSKLKYRDEDLKILNMDIQSLKKNNTKLDSDYHEEHRIVESLVTKLSTLEEENKEKTDLISRQQDLITSLAENGAIFEERNNLLKRDLDETTTNLKNTSLELSKAHEIIGKLQEDGRNLSRKIKTQALVLDELSLKLKKSAENLTAIKSKLEDTSNDAKVKEEQIVDYIKENDELKTRLKTAEDLNNSKEDMICSLKKQLNRHEGLSNLNKFRQAFNNTALENEEVAGLSVSKTQSQSSPHQASWINIYSNRSNSDGVPEENANLEKSEVRIVERQNKSQRPPTWASSNKATLESFLQKPRAPLWKK